MITRWLSIFTCLIVFWGNSRGQTIDLNKKVSFNYAHKRLSSILKHLTEKHALNFSYSNSMLPLKKRISLKANQQSLKKILKDLFDSMHIQHTLIGKSDCTAKKTDTTCKP